MKAIRTTCAYCGVGCGIAAKPGRARRVEIKGDDVHPANYGKLCSKGTHLGETVGLEGRLLHPMIGDRRAGWDEALELVAQGFSKAIKEHGPDSVAFYVSGQLLTEDYYVANKLMKGYIGSANIDTNSRLCMSSAVSAHIRAFGEDVVPCSYDDLDQADLILLVGSNTAWCHPVIWQRIEAARASRKTKLVVIDPRRTETAECADLHIAVRPDGDVALFNSLLAAMRDMAQINATFLSSHVEVPKGFFAGLSVDIAGAGISEQDFAALYRLVSTHSRMITLFSQGSNQSVCGTDKANAIINLHLATGRIGVPGAGPFSITGQPNAMGGREVGGLASTLAAHMGFSAEECASVKGFWQSPTIARNPGLKAVDMFRAVHDGRIKALWVMATNPAVSMPDAGFVREAMERCPLVVVSDVIADTDTARFAHVRLPALGWGEKEGMVTNSERLVSRQRALFKAPGEAKPDWWIICEVAKRMGFEDAFSYARPSRIFREFCAQTGVRNQGRRKLDLSGWASMSDASYDQWQPRQWGGKSPFTDGRFTTPSGRALIVQVEAPRAPHVDENYPFRLNTGRYRDQWHTMTRTGLSPRLSRHRREPLLEMHREDAWIVGLKQDDIARVKTEAGESLYRVIISEGQRRGEVFVPMHWTDRMSSGGRTGRLPKQVTDPVSGQPAFKNTPAAIEIVRVEWRGFLVAAEMPEFSDSHYWTRARVPAGWIVEMAGEDLIDIDSLLPQGERIEATDIARGTLRIAVRDKTGRIAALLFLTRSGILPSREWIVDQFCSGDPAEIPALLSGRAPAGTADCGPIVCVCFDVGMKTIMGAIASRNLTSVAEVGSCLRAGTNCGSCRPAIGKLLETTKGAAIAAE